MIKSLLLSLFTFSFMLGFSQSDVLLDLGINNTLRSYYNNNVDKPNSRYAKKNKQTEKSIVTLPFLDDFSQSDQ